MDSLIVLIKEYEIIGLGEATHGNEKNSKFRLDVIKKLVAENGVREIFFEEDPFTVKALMNAGKDLSINMNKMGWQNDNKYTRELVEFIHEFNKKNPPVTLFGYDVQISPDFKIPNSALGKEFRKWHTYFNNDYEKRDKAMAELFKYQHKKGTKAVVISHNFHLNKSIENIMGQFIEKEFPGKYINIANTFTRGTYRGIYFSDTFNEFQDVSVDIKDPIYTEDKPTLYFPPPKYIYGGDVRVDKEHPHKFFNKETRKGWDAVICINNETSLKPDSHNATVEYFKNKYKKKK